MTIRRDLCADGAAAQTMWPKPASSSRLAFTKAATKPRATVIPPHNVSRQWSSWTSGRCCQEVGGMAGWLLVSLVPAKPTGMPHFSRCGWGSTQCCCLLV
jgi:hypothetical protein